MNELTEEKAREIAAAHAEKYGGKMICVCFKCQQAKGYLLRVEQEKAHLSEREAVIAEREAEIKSLEWQMSKRLVDKLSFDEFETLRKEKDSEIAALKSKLGEAEKVLKRKLFEEASFHAGGCGCFLCEFLSSLRSATKGNLSTASDGEGK